jgi:hypothetical protein
MKEDSDILKTAKSRVHEPPKTMEWVGRTIGSIPGLVGLGGAIGLLQDLARSSIDNIYNQVFVANWIPWFAASFFALGWFTTHWIEVALLSKKVRMAKLLFLVVLFEGALFSIFFRYFVNHEMLHKFALAVPGLSISATFLRYSLFSKEAFAAQRKIMRGERVETLG